MTAIDQYEAELARIESGRGRTSLEHLFLLAYSLERTLTMPVRSGGASPLEELSAEEYQELAHRLRGISMNRDEVVFVDPDPAFFRQLGEKKGRTDDRLLMRLYSRTYDGSTWPVYIQQQTDYSGCTEFGPGKLTKLYGEWSHYRTMHGNRYKPVVAAELGRIQDELLRGTCACGDQDSVVNELRYFLRRHPGSPIARDVRARLEGLLHGKTNIRFNCASG